MNERIWKTTTTSLGLRDRRDLWLLTDLGHIEGPIVIAIEIQVVAVAVAVHAGCLAAAAAAAAVMMIILVMVSWIWFVCSVAN